MNDNIFTICRYCKHCRPAPWWIFMLRVFFPNEPIGVWIQAECKLRDVEIIDLVSGKKEIDTTLCSLINTYGECSNYEAK